MDGKSARLDRAMAELAGRQHGAVSTAQLKRLGFSEDAIRARVLAARLHRVHRGVYSVGHPELPPNGRLMAAVLAAGGRPAGEGGSVLGHWGAAVSHRSAAFVWGLLSMSAGPVDVAVSGDAGRRNRRGIRVHRSASLPPADVSLRDRVPVTSPRRTIADLRLALGAGYPGAVSKRELNRAIRQADVFGLPLGEEGRSDRTRSDLEADFLRLCRRHRVPAPEVNVPIGRHLVDFLWRAERVVVETDSFLYHRGRQAFMEDRRRDLELKNLGYEVIRISERQIEEESDQVAAAVLRMLRGARRGGPA